MTGGRLRSASAMRRLRIGPKILRVRDEPEPPPSHPGAPTPLVCIHGAGMSGVVWMDLLRQIAPARRIIALDLPGHGQSDPWHDSSTDLYRDAVGTMCAHLKVPRVVVIGHSLGGAVALRCAVSWPARIAAVILVASAARLDVPEELMRALAQELPKGDESMVETMPASLADLAFSPATHRDVRARWKAVLMQATRKVVLEDFALCRGLNLLPQLDQLRIPALLIGGADDLLVSTDQLAETQRAILGAEQAIIPDAGHFPMLEQPAAFVATLKQFLTTIPS